MEQLWLTVLEDHHRSEWPPTLDGQRWRVTLTPSATLQGCSYNAPYRTSPVFPVSEAFVLPQLAGRTVLLCFFCFDPAFEILGRLVAKAPSDVQSRLLFSIGLASVIYIANDDADVDTIETVAGGPAQAREVWLIQDSVLVKVDSNCRDTDPLDQAAFTLMPYDALQPGPRAAVDEFVSSIALILPKLAMHMRTEVATFANLVRRVGELVTEMVYVSQPVGDPPTTLSEYVAADFEPGSPLAETVLQQNTDRLLQINAALSYLSTQALSGAVPILERRSLIRRYSLLGIGTATLALTRIARSIETAFALGAVETVLAEHASTAAPLPGLTKLPDYDAMTWKSFSVNRWDGKVSRRELYPKLPYFSGRLGFREGEYTISAALQSLVAGAGPEWSLLTLTHEMLHGHVRNILSILFQADPASNPETKWQTFYDRYRVQVTEDGPVDQCLLDSLRAVILAYCCLSITHGSLTRQADYTRSLAEGLQVRLAFWLPRREALWKLLEVELRNISEILVHVLDLHYFYLSSLTAYVPLIWRSWSPLPQVRGDLRQYILRSLLVVAAKEQGTAYKRFGASRSHLVELLDPLARGRLPGASTVAHALEFLRDEDRFQLLFYPFKASLVLVDLADKVFTSGTIRGSLNKGDSHVEFRPDATSFEDWFEYSLSEGFVDERVVAPTAYLADRLAKAARSPGALSLELETVRMFLACCSNVDIGGGTDARQ